MLVVEGEVGCMEKRLSSIVDEGGVGGGGKNLICDGKPALVRHWPGVRVKAELARRKGVQGSVWTRALRGQGRKGGEWENGITQREGRKKLMWRKSHIIWYDLCDSLLRSSREQIHPLVPAGHKANKWILLPNLWYWERKAEDIWG